VPSLAALQLATQITPSSGQFLLPFLALDLNPFKLKETSVNSLVVLRRGSEFAGWLAACGNVPLSGTGNCLNCREICIICTNLGARGSALRFKPAGEDSIPDGVIGIFHCHHLSSRSVALGSTQTTTEMSTKDISWGVKAAGV